MDCIDESMMEAVLILNLNFSIFSLKENFIINSTLIHWWSSLTFSVLRVT